MKYFHMGIFLILWVYLIKKYGCQTKAFFSVNQCFLDHIKETQLKVRVDYTCPELQKLIFNVVINHGPLQYTVLCVVI